MIAFWTSKILHKASKTWFLCLFYIVGKAFAVATAIVFGGAALMFGMAASKLELHEVSITYYTQIDNILDASVLLAWKCDEIYGFSFI